MWISATLKLFEVYDVTLLWMGFKVYPTEATESL